MGFTSATAQLLTIPPYTVGALSSLTTGFFADRLTWRAPFICGGLTIVVVAYAVLYTKAVNIADNIGVCYFALCLACAGLYPITPGTNAWTLNNLGGPTRKAQGSAFMICMVRSPSRRTAYSGFWRPPVPEPLFVLFPIRQYFDLVLTCSPGKHWRYHRQLHVLRQRSPRVPDWLGSFLRPRQRRYCHGPVH